MFIAIHNQALKSFVGRLQALKDSYSLKVLTMTALEGTEIFYLQVDLQDDELSAFAQDAKFGFGNDFIIERVINDMKYDYQTQHFVELIAGENSEQQLLELRKMLSDASLNYRALEYRNDSDNVYVIRAYVANNQEQAQIEQLVG